MTDKNSGKLFIWILIIAVALFLLSDAPQSIKIKQEVQETYNNLMNSQSADSGTDQKTDVLSFKFFDENHNEVKLRNSAFAIVGGTPGIKYTRGTITVTNKGAYVLSCLPSSLSPSVFDIAMVDESIKSVPVSGKASWTSGDIDLDLIANPLAPVVFNTNIICTYYNSSSGVTITLPTKSAPVSMSILPDVNGGADFEVGILIGGIPTEYCGDTICQVSESPTSCPADCVVANNVKFRTTDLSYVSGTAVGYSTTCGNDLTAYGKTSGACTSYYCDQTAVLNVPSTSGTTKLFVDGDAICICEPGVVTHTYSKRYTTVDSDASKVDITKTGFDSAKEVSC